MDNTRIDANREPPPAPDAPPDLRVLGEYHLLRPLGAGGMGAVYLGYSGAKDRQLAIKVLSDQLAYTQGYIDRFYREARAGALLDHPNIVRTVTFGQDGPTGKHYLVMEYVDGPSAHQRLARHGPLAVGDAVHIALDVARALEHAHSRNIVHRDIKPDNILITRSGVAKLADLGLAKRTDEASHLTNARQGFGTPHYMPYEQALNARHADGRSDVYALGATLYHLVTGALPFPGDNHLDVVERKNQGAFAPASSLNPAVPPLLDGILARMLARQPRDRYQTASELIIDLERSRLASPVLSFADPSQALQDPQVHAYLEPAAEPTRLALDPADGTAGDAPPAGPDDLWQVRYRNRRGRLKRAQATTRQLVKRLRETGLPPGVEVRRVGEPAYRPLAQFAEFRGHRPPPMPGAPPAAKPRPEPPRPPVPEPPPAAAPAADDRRAWVPWAVAAGCVLAVAAAAAVLLSR